LEIAFSPEHISDSLLEAMSFAWPQLTKLKFQALPDALHLPSQCTFHGILHLAKRCPRLFSLTIPFMASAKIDWNGGFGGGPVNQNLKHFDVGNSRIDDSGMVASLLSDIFPNIQNIEASEDYNYEDDEECQNYDRWQEAIKQYMEKRVGSASGT
jgi:hypothetical protein